MPVEGKSDHTEDPEGERAPGIAIERFLAWFDDDPERALERWVRFRYRLIRYFLAKGCSDDAEDCAHDVFVRAIARLQQGALDVDNPQGFLMGYANNIVRERRKAHREVQPDEGFNPAGSPPRLDQEISAQQMLAAIRKLNREHYELLRLYYADEDNDSLAARRAQLAEERGTNANALRVEVHGIKRKILDRLRDARK